MNLDRYNSSYFLSASISPENQGTASELKRALGSNCINHPGPFHNSREQQEKSPGPLEVHLPWSPYGDKQSWLLTGLSSQRRLQEGSNLSTGFVVVLLLLSHKVMLTILIYQSTQNNVAESSGQCVLIGYKVYSEPLFLFKTQVSSFV